MSLVRSVTAALGVVDPRAALTFRPLSDQVAATLTRERLVARLSMFFGGLALLLGFFTRIAGGGRAIVMIVAVVSAKWGYVDSLETLLGFEETAYFAVFFWLAVTGASKVSIDYLLTKQS